MQHPNQRILILSSNTGGGHQSAAGALQESFLRLSPAGQVLVNISQVLEDANVLTHGMANLYNYLLRYHQHYMRYYYSAIHKLRPYESHFIFQLSMKYGAQVLERWAPTKLVSVHPMTQHFFAYILKKLRLLDKIPLITVVTDPCTGFWKGWACPEVSRYFVASEEAAHQLIDYGVPQERITISGMPVHSKFQPALSPTDKQLLRASLQLDPDRFTLLVNAGWIGGGNIPALYQTLMQAPFRDQIQLIFLAGRNQALYTQGLQMSREASFPVHVSGFTQDVNHLMNASDLMVSKLGGLTTFEAMACHLPILADCLTPPMPQEAGTARFIQEHGAGILIERPEQMIQSLDELLRHPNQYLALKEAAARVGRPGAVDRITTDILNDSQFMML